MESAIFETLGCRLDPDLLKSWERFSIESPHFYTSSETSQSADEETDSNDDDLMQQLKNLYFDDASDSQHLSSKSLNTTFEINSQKKKSVEKLIFVEKTGIDENQFSSSSLKNIKLLNNDFKSCSDTSVEEESDSDDDEQVESVTLRGRGPTRRNRSENNKQRRPNPFSPNPSKTYKQHLNLQNPQTSASITLAKERVNDVFPHLVGDKPIDSVVTSAGCSGNVNKFPAKINYAPYFDNSKEKIFIDSFDRDCAFPNGEKEAYLDSKFEDVTVEKAESYSLTESNSDSFSTQNLAYITAHFPLHVLSGTEVEKVLNNSYELNQNNTVASTFKELSYPKFNQYNFDTESDYLHSVVSELHIEKSSSNSNLVNNNCILEKSNEQHSYEYLDNKSGNYSDLISKNFTSINSECLSPAASDYINVSKEIDYKVRFDTSVDEESDTDDELVESVTLKRREPIRHNRPGNKKQQQTTPFPQNHSKIYKQHLNSSNSQTSANYHPILDEFNASPGGYEYLNRNNNTSSERQNRTFDSRFSDSVSVTDEVLDRDVPSAGDIRNLNKFPAKVNDAQCFDNLKEAKFYDSIVRDNGVTDEEIETTLDCQFEDLTAEELDRILESITKSNSGRFSSQNHAQITAHSPLHVLSGIEVEKVLNNSFELNQNNSFASTFKEISYPNINQYNFDTELDYLHSIVSEPHIEETSSNSNLVNNNCILENSNELHSYGHLYNKSGNYSDLVSKNFTSITSECLSLPATSGYINVSEEIEHGIVKFKDMEEWVKKGSKIVPKPSDPVTELGWEMFPFFHLDSKSISECINTSECEVSDKKDDSKSKHIDQSHKSSCRVERKILPVLRTVARDKLFHSSSFCVRQWEQEMEEIRKQIKKGKFGNEKKKVIHFLNRGRGTKYKGTNLHDAILKGNTEKVYCLLECNKECHNTTFEINLRDSCNKTVLDYSKEKGMHLLSDYLEENNAKQSIRV